MQANWEIILYLGVVALLGGSLFVSGGTRQSRIDRRPGTPLFPEMLHRTRILSKEIVARILACGVIGIVVYIWTAVLGIIAAFRLYDLIGVQIPIPAILLLCAGLGIYAAERTSVHLVLPMIDEQQTV